DRQVADMARLDPGSISADCPAARWTSRSRLVHHEIDPAAVTALAARCRACGASFHGALGAALLTASADAGATGRTLGLSSAVDLRRFLDGPDDVAHLSAGTRTFHHMVPDFWGLARDVSERVNESVQRADP